MQRRGGGPAAPQLEAGPTPWGTQHGLLPVSCEEPGGHRGHRNGLDQSPSPTSRGASVNLARSAWPVRRAGRCERVHSVQALSVALIVVSHGRLRALGTATMRAFPSDRHWRSHPRLRSDLQHQRGTIFAFHGAFKHIKDSSVSRPSRSRAPRRQCTTRAIAAAEHGAYLLLRRAKPVQPRRREPAHVKPRSIRRLAAPPQRCARRRRRPRRHCAHKRCSATGRVEGR